MTDFPTRFARTRRFSNGVPHSVRIAENGSRALFLRTAGPEDPVNALWSVDIRSGEEQLVCDPRRLGDEGDIPAEELARRERARESGGGIVAYSVTPDGSRACFALFGKLFVVDPGSADGAVELPVAGPIVDPRIAASGSAVAFVRHGRLWVTDLDGKERELAGEDAAAVSWGLAEHVAAEEMDRSRGHWWAPDSQQLLAARVDESMVDLWYVSDPSDPAAAPGTVRYPVAGSANADVTLALISLNGTRLPVDWDRAGFPYLAAVSFRTSEPLLLVQSRDQRTVQVLAVDRRTGETTVRHEDSDARWVELVPGTPDTTPDGRIITVTASGSDTYRLVFDGIPVTPEGLQVRSVCGSTRAGVIITASTDSTEVQVYRVGWDGALEAVTAEPGVHSASVGGDVVAVASTTMTSALPTIRILAETPIELASRADEPQLVPSPALVRLGERRLAAAVLYPSGHEPGSPLPVILDPYGGPHAQRVLARRSAYLLSQWIADQGFAVVVIDGRGTPGRGPAWDRAVHGDLASAPLQDQVDGLTAAAADHPDLDLDRVGIRGWSFGGYLALLAALRRPDLFKAAVAGAPVTEWRLYDTHYTERYLGTPNSNAANYDASSVLGDAAGLSGALQIIHGLNDDNVVVRHSLLLSRELLLRGKMHDCLLIPGITHMASDPSIYSALLHREIEFFRRALG